MPNTTSIIKEKKETIIRLPLKRGDLVIPTGAEFYYVILVDSVSEDGKLFNGMVINSKNSFSPVGLFRTGLPISSFEYFYGEVVITQL
jgi:hypothetical protein